VVIQSLEQRTLFSYIDMDQSSIPSELYEASQVQFTQHIVLSGWDYANISVDGGEAFSQMPNDDYVRSVDEYVDDDRSYSVSVTDNYSQTDVFTVDVYNVAPCATLSTDLGDEGEGLVTMALSDIQEPSQADRDAGIRFAWGYDYAQLEYNWDNNRTTDAAYSFDPTLDADQQYYFRVGDKDNGHSDYSSTLGPLPTLNVYGAEVTSTSIPLHWIDTASGEAHWIVQRAPNGGTFSTIDTLDGVAGSGSAMSYTDTGLPSGTRYVYRVRAEGNGADTPYSPKQYVSTLVKTPYPTGQTASRATGTNDITIDWDDQPGVTFKVYRNGVGGTPIYSGTDNFYTDTSTKTPQTAYTYQIVATVVGQEDSLPVGATQWTMPETPTGLQAFVVSGTHVKLYWENGYNVGYRVYRGLSPSFVPDLQYSTNRVVGSNEDPNGYYNPGGTTIEWDDTTAAVNTDYYYKVAAFWVGSAESLPSDAVEADTSTPVTTEVAFSFDTSISNYVTLRTFGELDIPLVTDQGVLLSFSVSPADEFQPFTLSDDYSVARNDTTGNEVLTLNSNGMYVLQIKRVRGSVVNTLGLCVTNGDFSSSAAQQLFGMEAMEAGEAAVGIGAWFEASGVEIPEVPPVLIAVELGVDLGIEIYDSGVGDYIGTTWIGEHLGTVVGELIFGGEGGYGDGGSTGTPGGAGAINFGVEDVIDLNTHINLGAVTVSIVVFVVENPFADGGPFPHFEDATGIEGPAENLENIGPAKNPTMIEHGFTEKWIGQDPDTGDWYSAYRNPDTDEWAGGKPSSHEE
jgi:hypothetical protein